MGVLALILSAGSGSVDAVTYHVSPFGSNTPPYQGYLDAANDPADAFAIALDSFDTVWIHTGSYDIDSTINVAPGVAVQGSGIDSTVLVWSVGYQVRNWMLRVEGNNVISGIRFVEAQQGYDGDLPTAVYLSRSDFVSLKITDCYFDGMGVRLGGWGRREVSSCYFYLRSAMGCFIPTTPNGGLVEIHDNVFFGGVGFQALGSLGVLVQGAAVICSNIFDFSRSDKRGVLIHVDRPNRGVDIRNNLLMGGDDAVIWYNGDGTFENNTVTGPHEDLHPAFGSYFILDDVHSVVVRNNAWIGLAFPIRFGNLCDDCPPASGFTYHYNVLWPPVDSFFRYPESINPIDVYVDTLANFNALPMFADSLFRLQAFSPLIDAGDPMILDVDGSRSDIGWTGGPGGDSYEYLDLPPAAPETLLVSGEANSVHLSWSRRHERDLAIYRIYRGHSSGFWGPGLPPLIELSGSDTTRIDTLPFGTDSAFYVVIAVDSSGNSSDSSPEVRYVVAEHPTNHPPMWTAVGDHVLRIGDTLRVAVSASDPDGDTLTLSLSDAPANATLTDYDSGDGVLTFAPDSTQTGQLHFTLVASDGALSDTLCFSVTVSELSHRSGIRKVYPNPASSLCSVEIEIAPAGHTEHDVELVLCDILGRRVSTLYSASTAPGAWTIPVELSEDALTVDLASGVYLLLLKIDSRMVGVPYKIAIVK